MAPFDPETIYQARVAWPVSLGPLRYLPRDDLRCKGKVLNRIVAAHGADAVAFAGPNPEPITE